MYFRENRYNISYKTFYIFSSRQSLKIGHPQNPSTNTTWSLSESTNWTTTVWDGSLPLRRTSKPICSRFQHSSNRTMGGGGVQQAMGAHYLLCVDAALELRLTSAVLRLLAVQSMITLVLGHFAPAPSTVAIAVLDYFALSTAIFAVLGHLTPVRPSLLFSVISRKTSIPC